MNVKLGLENLLAGQLDRVVGRRVGLVASPSSVDRDLTSTVTILHQHPDVRLVALFGPEHGLRGEAQAGESVSMYTDPSTNLPVYSLYGETHQPTPAMLQGIDVLVFDIQDGGIRFYTYLATLAHVMQAAAEQRLPVIVLDRPTPIGGLKVEGPVLDPAYRSFVGPYPIPIRYGMTMGEIARLFNDVFEIGCPLEIVRLSGWKRSMWFDQTGLPFVPPSPNLPTLQALTLYPGTCLIEGTNLSEGRGTTRPFEYVGAPWIDAENLALRLNDLELPGVRFRPVYFVPTFSKYRDQPCQGVHIYVQDREKFQPIVTTLHLVACVRSTYPDHFAWREPWVSGGHYPIDLLSGGSAVREHLDANKPIPDLVDGWKEALDAFCDRRAHFLLYPN
jgi:beta-N-acetylhexosaminidase